MTKIHRIFLSSFFSTIEDDFGRYLFILLFLFTSQPVSHTFRIFFRLLFSLVSLFSLCVCINFRSIFSRSLSLFINIFSIQKKKIHSSIDDDDDGNKKFNLVYGKKTNLHGIEYSSSIDSFVRNFFFPFFHQNIHNKNMTKTTKPTHKQTLFESYYVKMFIFLSSKTMFRNNCLVGKKFPETFLSIDYVWLFLKTIIILLDRK